MKCDTCDKQASVHLTQVLDGKMQKMHLCEACAKEMGVGQAAGFSMSDVLLGKGLASPLTRGGGAKTCPVCGWSLRKVKKIGRFGCPDCYEAFGEEVKKVLHSIHEATRHQGRRPTHTEMRLSLRDREETLQAAIAKAIEDEAYEDAASLRDELRALKHSSDDA